MPSTSKFYCPGRTGQVHARSIESDGVPVHPPLFCLHPAPSSGLYFQNALPLLNSGRRVVAPDYPGYGGSDAATLDPTIATYADAMLECIDSLGVQQQVDLLGFHTGCLVAAEMIHKAPTRVRRAIFCDAPYFDVDTRQNLRSKMANPMAVDANLMSLAAVWDFNVSKRIDDVPLDRALELFAEHLRTGRQDYRGFAAAFGYDCESSFANLSGDITLLATRSGLHAATVAASKVIPNARFVDVPEVTTAVFEKGATAICKRIHKALIA